jgi:hypothetical protein
MLVAAVVVEPLLAVMEAWVVEAMAVRVRLLVVLEALLLVAGGGAGQPNTLSGGSGGSGVVVLRVPNTAAAVFSGGVATRSYDVVGYTTYEVQATTTTGETVTFYPNAFLVEYLVVAGGGGGGGDGNTTGGAGGGAGGYLASADAVAMAVVTGQAYPIIVGGGGTGRTSRTDNGSNGSDSQFASIRSSGGGRGAYSQGVNGVSGGSGGGGNYSPSAGGSGNNPFRSPSQGNDGGAGTSAHLRTEVEVVAAVRVGLDQWAGTGPAGGNGGAGTSNDISGTPPFFMLVGAEVEHTMEVLLVQEAQVSEGVGALQLTQIIPAQTEQMVVEAAAEAAQFLQAGQSNGGNGGNGVVIIKIPNTRSATFTGGVTETNSTAGGYTTYIVTATSTTNETVTFS